MLADEIFCFVSRQRLKKEQEARIEADKQRVDLETKLKRFEEEAALAQMGKMIWNFLKFDVYFGRSFINLN